ncbi:MAG: hypothetical protein WC692_05515 [Erythrobacter sp.]|jgi:hypothetical protein
MNRARIIAATAMAAALTAASGAALAQQRPPAQDDVLIAAGEGSGNGGRVSINIASGSQNQQASAATIVIGEIASQSIAVQQAIDNADLTDRATSIAIGPGALSNNGGLVSLNVTAGNQNQSANLAALAIGNRGVVSDLMLAQASAPTEPSGPTAHGLDPRNDSVIVDDTALGGNSGLVQVNLIGGERNSSANTFALNISAGGNP